jgi:hypothetical protein
VKLLTCNLSFAVKDGESGILSKVRDHYCIVPLALRDEIPRNKDKLQAYQREYAQRKRAPGHRKVGKAKRTLLEEQHAQKHQLMEMEVLPACSKAAFGQCVCPPSCRLVLTQISRAYACALIVRSQAADPRRTLGMIEDEEKAQDHFEEIKDILQLFCLRGWIDQFQKHVEDFIQERLAEAASIMAVPGTEDSVRLHGLRRLVAGAFQEGELVRQPEYATTSAKLDSAVVWQGRGCVIQLICYFLPSNVHSELI